MDLSNVYFVIGTSYAGKSTIVKNLAKKHHGIALEENYHDAKLPELDSREFPGLTYTRDLQDWHEFIRRTPDEYATWLESTKKECEIVELEEPDPQAALDNYREILTRICSKECYDELLHSGFKVIFRDENRSQEETVVLAEQIFGISQ